MYNLFQLTLEFVHIFSLTALKSSSLSTNHILGRIIHKCMKLPTLILILNLRK
ncbi:uncharacterized protein DS421_14g463290 [Arachis hypogaea]|nr:uncharacterized protein DS421_14g463290 [Arachis hypogaea]